MRCRGSGAGLLCPVQPCQNIRFRGGGSCQQPGGDAFKVQLFHGCFIRRGYGGGGLLCVLYGLPGLAPGIQRGGLTLDDLRRSGLADNILGHAERGKWIFGICGGLQILGRAILDPHGIESAAPEVPGLGLMDLRSTFAADKTLVRVARAETPLGVPSGGYEIHHGLTDHGPSALPLFLRADRAYPSEAERICGYVSGRRWATYLHGVFDDDTFRRTWIDHVRTDLGLTPQRRCLASYDLEKALDRLADVVRANSDMETIYRSMGLK